MNTGEHLSEDALWEAAKAPPVGDDYAHLQLCPDCRLKLDSIKFAQSMLVEPPPPPALSEQSARRIGTVLRKAAEKEARRAQWWGSWWPFNWSPTWALAPIAAALLAFVAYRMTGPLPSEGVPSPIAKNDSTPLMVPTPPPMPEAPRPLPVKKVVASVKRTKGAKSGTGALKKSQQLSEGSVVATAKGGELLMALPDGSQIGLMSASQVQLAKLEDKAVTLDIDKGSMKVTALHDPTRELRVRAGDLEVFDVGTEFIVSRDEGRTLVAVEEGEVEVRTPNGESTPVTAGHAVEYRGGKLERQQWATADELPKAHPPVAPRPVKPSAPVAHAPKKGSVEDTPEIPTEPQKATPPAAPVQDPEQPTAKQPEVATKDPVPGDEWTTPDNLATAPVNVPPPVPPPEPAPTQPPLAVAPPPQPPPQTLAPKSEDEEQVSFMSKLQQHLAKVKGAFQPRSRDLRANDIIALTDARRCAEAVATADAWLTEPVPRGESFNLRRSVLSSKLRCLNYMGRASDAAAVQRELDKL